MNAYVHAANFYLSKILCTAIACAVIILLIHLHHVFKSLKRDDDVRVIDAEKRSNKNYFVSW